VCVCGESEKKRKKKKTIIKKKNYKPNELDS